MTEPKRVPDVAKMTGREIMAHVFDEPFVDAVDRWLADYDGEPVSTLPPPPILSRPVRQVHNPEWVRLILNRLEGPLPPELAKATGLEELLLAGNRLTGPVPTEFTRLSALYAFTWEANNGLCAPADREFQDWLKGISAKFGPTCEN